MASTKPWRIRIRCIYRWGRTENYITKKKTIPGVAANTAASEEENVKGGYLIDYISVKPVKDAIPYTERCHDHGKRPPRPAYAPTDKARITHAADLRGLPLSAFVRDAALREAESVLAADMTITSSPKESRRFLAALGKLSYPTPSSSRRWNADSRLQFEPPKQISCPPLGQHHTTPPRPLPAYTSAPLRA
jgi:uncharacterized protein (DUF1778 family)